MNKLVCLFCLMLSTVVQAQTLMIGNFSSGDLSHWQDKEFFGLTDYRIVTLQDKKVLRAVSTASASGLFHAQRIDLWETPYLNWSWRIENPLPARNEQEKQGDDFSARIYIVIDGGLVFWKTRALNYVWSGNSEKGKTWPNPYTGKNTMMIVQRSAQDALQTWYTEKRNILADWQTIYGEAPRYIDAVAVMTDSDNSQSQTTAYYGNIYFSAN